MWERGVLHIRQPRGAREKSGSFRMPELSDNQLTTKTNVMWIPLDLLQRWFSSKPVMEERPISGTIGFLNSPTNTESFAATGGGKDVHPHQTGIPTIGLLIQGSRKSSTW